MQLDIGGAETHVVELAKELKNRGYNIIVASNGGVYVGELEECGIKHYTVPLHNKKPSNVIAARKMLREIIINEKIDLVHSHARIPSFILGRLHRQMKFPFVTTAHWVFSTKMGLKYITNWGQRTIAVSEDIKKYLMDNYKIPEEHITVTINGIDTEKFSPDTDKTAAMREFDLKEDDNTIVYVSRMDEDRSLVAKQLIRVLPSLDGVIDSLKLIIVGGGNDFENVRTLADEANAKMGRCVISLAGPRTDINTLVAPAKLFVGVSRAALEAMAAAKPTIIAGNEGYIGLFTEDKLETAIQTNFCCRGCEQSTEALLSQEIGSFFGMWDEDTAKIGSFGRETIKRLYSVKKMADDNEKVYKVFL